ncbi:MAG: diacylglycerol kinase family lipid kinase [bacterium]|nr:diacylglycerol kinase family lipid kinase [bacterium]
MDKVHVIVNPNSARGKTEARWNNIKEVITHYFREFKYVFTEKPMHATEIARDLLNDGVDLVIGVGGDGTLNEITNGFFKKNSSEAINNEASLGIIPSGTGSDFVRYLKVPNDFRRSIQLIKDSKMRQFDVGKVMFGVPGGGDSDKDKYFINVSDFGLGAEVVHHMDGIPAGKRSAFSYYKGLLSTIKTYKSKNVRIVLDDNEEINGRYLIGAVANGRIFGGGMIIAPKAEPDDGYFDLVLIDDMTRFQIILNSRHLYTGGIDKHPKATVKRAKNIKVFPADDEPVKIEFDGELGQSVPVEYQIIEKGVNFRI